MSTTETITLTPSKPPEPPAMGSSEAVRAAEPSFALMPGKPCGSGLMTFPISEVIAKVNGACVVVGCKFPEPYSAAMRMDLELEQAKDLHRQLTAAITALKITLAGGAS